MFQNEVVRIVDFEGWVLVLFAAICSDFGFGFRDLDFRVCKPAFDSDKTLISKL